MEVQVPIIFATEFHSGRHIQLVAMLSRNDASSTFASASLATQYFHLPHPHDPGRFSGRDGIDVEEWLRMYEHVSERNRMKLIIMLVNVNFDMDANPHVWFHRHKEEPTSWELFKQKLSNLFGNPSGLQLATKMQLSTRAQTATES